MDVEDIETRLVAEGRAEGELYGEALGETEGMQFGVEAGEKLGAELGHIKGCCVAWRHCSAVDASFSSERAAKSLRVLEQLVDAVPRLNTPDEDFMRQLALCRAKYKVVKSLLGLVEPAAPPSKSLAF